MMHFWGWQNLEGFETEVLLGDEAWMEAARFWKILMEIFTLSWTLPCPLSTYCPLYVCEQLSSNMSFPRMPFLEIWRLQSETWAQVNLSCINWQPYDIVSPQPGKPFLKFRPSSLEIFLLSLLRNNLQAAFVLWGLRRNTSLSQSIVFGLLLRKTSPSGYLVPISETTWSAKVKFIQISLCPNTKKFLY